VPAYSYHIFGLSIISQIEIPEMATSPVDLPDIIIQFGKVPDHLEHVLSKGILFESNKKEFLLRLPNIGRYFVKDGSEVIIDARKETTPEEVRLFLLGSVLGAVLYQRGMMPFHGSAVEVDGEALLITGNSAAGKSSLAAALHAAGYPFISDDLSAIFEDRTGNCLIRRGIPSVKLWNDSRAQLFPDEAFPRVRPQVSKFRIPLIPKNTAVEEFRISTILRLVPVNSKELKSHAEHGAQKFSLLRDNIYRDQLIKGMGVQEDHFHMLGLLASQTRLFTIERPSVPLNINALQEFVIQKILKS
jgi:hypothetical protein